MQREALALEGVVMLEVMKQKLADEIDRLMHELTVTLPKAIKHAAELGDLSENAEYKSALERQQFVQARLNTSPMRKSGPRSTPLWPPTSAGP
jgi:transcription elongation factor GreA